MPPAADQSTILNAFAAEGLTPHRWSNGPGAQYTVHRHSYHKVLYVLSGSITFTLHAGGETHRLRPGDRLDLPAGTDHSALIGPEGVVCLEAAREER